MEGSCLGEGRAGKRGQTPQTAFKFLSHRQPPGDPVAFWENVTVESVCSSVYSHRSSFRSPLKEPWEDETLPSRWGRSVFFLSFLTDSDCLLTEVTGIWADCLCVVFGLRQSGLCTDVVTENYMGLKIFNFTYYRTVLAKYLKCLFYCFSKADRNEDGTLEG